MISKASWLFEDVLQLVICVALRVWVQSGVSLIQTRLGGKAALVHKVAIRHVYDL